MTDHPSSDAFWLRRFRDNAERLTRTGAYHPSREHDACGVGLIASIGGDPNREVVTLAISALKAVWHRGAVAADGKTGDGAGIHVQVPQAFFADCVERTGHECLPGRIGIGMIFLPRTDYDNQERCRAIVESEIIGSGYTIYGWRQVPVNVDVIGTRARDTRPEIEQIMIHCPENVAEDQLERELYVIRRRIEKRVHAQAIKDFYICSLSARSVIYKGMFLAEQLSTFYPDLADERFVSAFAIYHQRYSTNTVPTWWLAQPFRMLAHNGEINTIKGNVNWMKSHEIHMAADVLENSVEDIKPVIGPDLSDSAALDAVFELLVRTGRSAPMAKTFLIPEAWGKDTGALPQAHRDMYAYTNAVMEPWDGPAAIAATDGRWVIAGLDRNGLRPMRFVRTTDGLLVVGSECGMCVIEEERIEEKGHLGPGQTIGADLVRGEFYHDRPLKDLLSGSQPFHNWIRNIHALDSVVGPGPEPSLTPADRHCRQMAVGMTMEDMEMVLHPMVESGKEAVGSMGDDAPLAILSDLYRPLSHFLRQNFSQVTNPPIDPLREERVMSLRTRFGNLSNVLAEDPFASEVIVLESPVLTNGMMERLKTHLDDSVREIDCTFARDPAAAPGQSLGTVLDTIRDQAEEAVRSGAAHLILTDEHTGPGRIGVPMILATAGVHTHLVQAGLRNETSINIRSAECLDTHYFAVLIGCGATTVNAYLAQDTLMDRQARGLFGERDAGACVMRHKQAIEAGLLKILSKMGISVISAYRGGFNFEAVGLSRALVNEFFPGMPSRISGIGLAGIEKKAVDQHARAYDEEVVTLPVGGFYRFRQSGEAHAYQGPLIHMLQEAVGREDYKLFKTYTNGLAKSKPVNLRDLLDFRPLSEPVPLDEVETVNAIRKRFVTPGMSLGALSPEAHRTLNIAMNRIGAKSDSGEGGEDPAHFVRMDNGDNPNSAIKQVASGRFGVTAEYLNQCREIEIKVAQGAKPGEGGQLPGFKVTEMIARLRHATPGVTLISPPPHHDIYSIEDLAQLIYDLKQIAPEAKVGVKLVAATGIGTIASGVAKAQADVILVSGHVGGTGASPLTSIKYAGIPWELGLSEVNQVLTLHALRHRITLRADGGIRSGRDVVIAALLGAEEFGIGTASLVAMGCLMVRQCHSNTCPVGVCTQDKALREKFTGTPEKVIALMSFIAEEVREILAGLGARSLEEIVGRADLLAQVSRGAAHLDDLDLNPILTVADPGESPRVCASKERNPVPDSLDAQIERDAAPFLERGEKMNLTYTVRNTQRAIGARMSSHIVRLFGMDRLSDGHLTVELHGSAGQSLGAFAVKGLRLDLLGDANDYVGKGLSGGLLVIRPPGDSRRTPQDHTIIGNTVLYGATAGRLFAAGRAGERFAVRNSGADAVVEGCGSNGCEYMTGGTAVILGPVGENFAAGMTGGMAFVYDPDGLFPTRVNPDTVHIQSIESAHWEGVLKDLISAHRKETGSLIAQLLLDNWAEECRRFVQVCPREMMSRLEQPLSPAAMPSR